MTEGQTIFAGYLVLLVVGFVVICLPIFIAFGREHPNRWPIFVLTVALGATLIGWLVALVWSLHGVHRSKGAVANGGESGLNLFANDAKPLLNHGSSDPVLPFAAVQPSTERYGIRWAAIQIDAITSLRSRNALTDVEHVLLKKSILERV